MAVPESGRLLFDGVAPALIAWEGDAHPAASLPDSGCRLERLELRHPQAEELLRTFPAIGTMERVVLQTGRSVELLAHILTPSGARVLR